MKEKEPCTHENCNLPFYGKNLCRKHYMAAYRHTFINGSRDGRRATPDDIWNGIVEILGIVGSNERKIKI